MTATKSRTYNKHDPQQIAVTALKLGGTNIKASDLGTYAVLRRALQAKVITPTSKVVATGKKGRPAHLYTLTLKGRNLAKRA